MLWLRSCVKRHNCKSSTAWMHYKHSCEKLNSRGLEDGNITGRIAPGKQSQPYPHTSSNTPLNPEVPPTLPFSPQKRARLQPTPEWMEKQLPALPSLTQPCRGRHNSACNNDICSDSCFGEQGDLLPPKEDIYHLDQ